MPNHLLNQALGQAAPLQPSQDAFSQAQGLIDQRTPPAANVQAQGQDPLQDPSIVEMAQRILDEGLPFPPAGTPLMAAIQSLMQTREAPAALEGLGSPGLLDTLKNALGNFGG